MQTAPGFFVRRADPPEARSIPPSRPWSLASIMVPPRCHLDLKGYIRGPANIHLRFKGCQAGLIPVEYTAYEPDKGKFTPKGTPRKRHGSPEPGQCTPPNAVSDMQARPRPRYAPFASAQTIRATQATPCTAPAHTRPTHTNHMAAPTRHTPYKPYTPRTHHVLRTPYGQAMRIHRPHPRNRARRARPAPTV